MIVFVNHILVPYIANNVGLVMLYFDKPSFFQLIHQRGKSGGEVIDLMLVNCDTYYYATNVCIIAPATS